MYRRSLLQAGGVLAGAMAGPHPKNSKTLYAQSDSIETSVFNVKKYGAEGDGKVDDFGAIQAAIDDAEATGGIVYFPAGRYRHTERLVVKSGFVSLSGPVLRAAELQADGFTGPAVEIAGSKSNKFNGGNTIQNLGIAGDDTNTKHGLLARYVIHGSLAIRNVWARRCTGSQIRLDNCWGANVQGCFAGGGNIGRRGVEVINANTVDILGCYCLNGSDDDDAYAIRLTNVDGARLAGNTTEEWGHGVVIEDGYHGGVTITGHYAERQRANDPTHIWLGASEALPAATVMGGHLPHSGKEAIRVDQVQEALIMGTSSNGGYLSATKYAGDVARLQLHDMPSTGNREAIRVI